MSAPPHALRRVDELAARGRLGLAARRYCALRRLLSPEADDAPRLDWDPSRDVDLQFHRRKAAASPRVRALRRSLRRDCAAFPALTGLRRLDAAWALQARDYERAAAGPWAAEAETLETLDRGLFDRVDDVLSRAVPRDARGPARLPALRRRAFLASKTGLHRAALRDLDEILKNDPGCSWAYAERVHVFTENGDLERALADCGVLARRFPDRGWPLALRGRALAKCGRLSESLPDLAEAVRREPKRGALRAWLGEAKRRLGRNADAVVDLDRALKDDPWYSLAWLWRGRALLSLGKDREALRDLDRAAALFPSHVVIRAARIEANLKLGRFAAAIADYEAAYPLGPAQVWSVPDGRSPDDGRLACARDDLRKLAKRGPREPWPRLWIGHLSGRPAAPPRAASRLVRGWAAAWAGLAALERGGARAAAASLSSACRLLPKSAVARGLLGRARAAAGDLDGAGTDASRAIALDPHQPLWHADRGEIELRLGRPREAVEHLARGRTLGDPRVHRLLGEARRRSGDLLGAAADFREALDKSPRRR